MSSFFIVLLPLLFTQIKIITPSKLIYAGYFVVMGDKGISCCSGVDQIKVG
jgi:hypothetical protein